MRSHQYGSHEFDYLVFKKKFIREKCGKLHLLDHVANDICFTVRL